jgi:hypothetical protein
VPLGQHVRRDENSRLLLASGPLFLRQRVGVEPPRDAVALRGRGRAVDLYDPADRRVPCQALIKVSGRIAELRENQDLLLGELTGQQLPQTRDFPVIPLGR